MQISTSKFFKDNKIAQALRKSEICGLWKFISAYHTKLREKSSYYLLIMYMKNIAVNQDRHNFLKHVCRICNLQLCYNFALMLHENALIFSQSEVCNFFMSIISYLTNHSLEDKHIDDFALPYKTNRFHVALGLYSNTKCRSQKTKIYGKSISDLCVPFSVLTTFLHFLLSLTEQRHNNMEYIC